jgi:hypothetical protein
MLVFQQFVKYLFLRVLLFIELQLFVVLFVLRDLFKASQLCLFLTYFGFYRDIGVVLQSLRFHDQVVL